MGTINIKRLIFDKSLNQRMLAQIMGCQQSEVSLFANGKREINDKQLSALIDYFGEEVINDYTLPSDAFEPKVRDAKVTIVDADIIEEAKQLGREEVRGGDVIEVDAEDIKKFSLPFVTNDIAQSPNVDVKALVTTNSPKLGRYPIGQKLSGVSYAQRIITEAMSGANFFPGDIIFLTYLDKTQLISDSAYLLDTKDYGTLFRLVTIEKDGLLLRPCSDDKERFKPIFMREDEILSYAALVMQVRTSFSFSNGIHLAEMVKSRDEQIARLTTSHQELITAQSQVLHNQAELIAEIRDERKHSRELTNQLLNKK
mgnify:CR=1 FL=1